MEHGCVAMSEGEEQSEDDCPFPLCPRCGEPVLLVTSRGPHDHEANPCGCRVSGNLLE